MNNNQFVGESLRIDFEKHQIRIECAKNDILVDDCGREYIDLFSAHGSTWLGHRNSVVMESVATQLDKVWITGGLETQVLGEARSAVESFFPDSHSMLCLYSTGMEATEFAMRLARVATGKNGMVGFERSMHGKSLATSQLAWDNKGAPSISHSVRLPFLPTTSEAKTLSALDAALETGTVAAVFVEPLQGSGGGHMASPHFYNEVYSRCRVHDVLVVFDEILTGFFRTGPAFFYSDLEFVPDVILIGKSMGNGFPVSAVVARNEYRVVPEMLCGSTFSSNPLAASAVLATLRQMKAMNITDRVAVIDEKIQSGLSEVHRVGAILRGRGALWILEIPRHVNVGALVIDIYRQGVAVNYTGQHLRLLPPATIGVDNLSSACEVILNSLLNHSKNSET